MAACSLTGLHHALLDLRNGQVGSVCRISLLREIKLNDLLILGKRFDAQPFANSLAIDFLLRITNHDKLDLLVAFQELGWDLNCKLLLMIVSKEL